MSNLAYWEGEAGDAYTKRNPATQQAVESRRRLWAEIVNRMLPACPRSVLEVGANVGLNLRALRGVLPPGTCYSATEPNDLARRVLETDQPGTHVYRDISEVEGVADLALTAGVMIHVPPDELLRFCRDIHVRASRWIVAMEYFSKESREIEYRGEMGKLWARDFGSFWLDSFDDLHPVACGFAWSRLFPTVDDVVWFLLEKR